MLSANDPMLLRDRWARLRFVIVGPLLAAPPKDGELKAALTELAQKTWLHPRTGEPVRFGYSTLEKWLYAPKGQLQSASHNISYAYSTRW